MQLNETQILTHIQPEYVEKLTRLIILPEVNSTNTYAFDFAKSYKDSLDVIAIFSEKQTAGRARQDKVWISPPQNIYLSLLKRWKINLMALQNLSVDIGITIINALKECGLQNKYDLKLPNDILYKNKKLAGILIETRPITKDVYDVVIGVGININIKNEDGEKITQNWIDLARIEQNLPSRNKIAGILLNRLIAFLARK